MTFTAENYQQIAEEEGPQAERLAVILEDLYHPRSVVDMGCANGLYLKPFLEMGKWVLGYELSEDSHEGSLIPKNRIIITDVTKNMEPAFADLAICLEVLEHIPENKGFAAIKNLTQMSDRIIFTAAIPGQGGNGHINCQPKAYWQGMFAALGFSRRVVHEDYILYRIRQGYHMGWFTQNLIVLERDYESIQ